MWMQWTIIRLHNLCNFVMSFASELNNKFSVGSESMILWFTIQNNVMDLSIWADGKLLWTLNIMLKIYCLFQHFQHFFNSIINQFLFRILRFKIIVSYWVLTRTVLFGMRFENNFYLCVVSVVSRSIEPECFISFQSKH